VALGYNVTDSLIFSQVVLSITLPVPMIALLVLSRRRSIMGEFTTGPMMSVVAAAAAVGVLALNTVLLAQSLGVAM